MVTPSSKERAAEDMGTAINNLLLPCGLCSLQADGQKFAWGQHPQAQAYLLQSQEAEESRVRPEC